MKNAFFLLFIGVCLVSQAQIDSIQQLDEVLITATPLHKKSKAHKIISINDSIIVNNLESFTALLRFNAPIYLKEYGQGGTSSASFRGTSSSNTAVMWNGININSINNGQTGFNSLTVGLYDAIDIRSGGGSIEYGSGAVGGTIHLQDVLRFSNHKRFNHQFVSSIGSFTTLNSLYKLKYNDAKKAFNFGISYNQSDNDYPFIKSQYRNSNGAYHNISVNFANSYKLSKNYQLDLYSSTYFGDRLFSGELPNPTFAKSKYKDISNRNLAKLKYHNNKIDIITRLAYLYQEYQYFADKSIPTYNFGSSDRYFLDTELTYQVFKNAKIIANSRFESIFGRTDRIEEHNRKEFSQAVMFNHSINNTFWYDLKVRKDFNSDYKVPISYVVGFRYKPLKKLFIRANTSKNYRVPTYNDLYWPNQGNKNLIPESSIQGEVGVGFQNKNIFFDLAYFIIISKDNIVWTPNGDPNRLGVWVPINLEKTKNTGLEASLNYKNKIFNNFLINTNLNYAYTIAKNEKIDKLLPFVPKHLLNANISISKNRYRLFFQHLFNGKIYTTISNSKDYIIKHFNVSNVGVSYQLLQSQDNNLTLGIKVNNLFNKDYRVLQNRPMPGTNFNFNINYKF